MIFFRRMYLCLLGILSIVCTAKACPMNGNGDCSRNAMFERGAPPGRRVAIRPTRDRVPQYTQRQRRRGHIPNESDALLRQVLEEQRAYRRNENPNPNEPEEKSFQVTKKFAQILTGGGTKGRRVRDVREKQVGPSFSTEGRHQHNDDRVGRRLRGEQEEKLRLQAEVDEQARLREADMHKQDRETNEKSTNSILSNVIPRIPITSKPADAFSQQLRPIQAFAPQGNALMGTNIQYIIIPQEQVVHEKPPITRTIVVEEYIIPGLPHEDEAGGTAQVLSSTYPKTYTV